MVSKAPFRGSRRRFVDGSVASFAAIAFLGTPAGAAQFEFKCASNMAPDHPTTIRMTQLWSAIEQESGGRIHTQFFPNSQLGGDSAMFSQLRLGALQFYCINPGSLASIVPAVDIGSLGLVFKDDDEGLRVLNGPLGTYLRREVAVKGIYVCRTYWDSGMNQVASSSHAIRTPDDLHGFRLRVPESKITIDLFKTLGASPTTLSVSEIYTGLQTKIIDGEAAPLATIEASRWYEVNKYLSVTNHSLSGSWLIANGDAWKSLPTDLQEVVERNNTKFAALGARDVKALAISLAAQMARQGIAFNKVDQQPFRLRLRSYYETWATTFGPTEWGLLQSSLSTRLI
jgi:TRAP-type transport system periplasmic protein